MPVVQRIHYKKKLRYRKEHSASVVLSWFLSGDNLSVFLQRVRIARNAKRCTS